MRLINRLTEYADTLFHDIDRFEEFMLIRDAMNKILELQEFKERFEEDRNREYYFSDLAIDLSFMSHDQLVKECKARNLRSTGRKRDLVKIIMEHEKQLEYYD